MHPVGDIYKEVWNVWAVQGKVNSLCSEQCGDSQLIHHCKGLFCTLTFHVLWREQSGLLLLVIHLLLFFIGILQRSWGASALFECQRLRQKETAVPTELCTVFSHDYDGLSSVSAHLWMLRTPFIPRQYSESQAVTKNPGMLKYFELIRMEENAEFTSSELW